LTDETPRSESISSKAEPRRTPDRAQPGWTMTRMLAVLFLIPSVPMLLGSVAALALFYVAPVRFGGLIARLPADEFIRTVLFFAPATLFALVVLAFLYAREPGPSVPVPARPPSVRPIRTDPARSLARWSLGLIVPAFVLTLLLLLFSQVAPGRFSDWIEPLPGDRFLRPLIPVAPLVLLVLGLPAMSFAFRRGPAARPKDRSIAPAMSARAAVVLILASGIAMLALSLIALGVSYVRPDRFQQLMSRLEPGTFLRLALLFAPATLTAVVILALLYLLARSSPGPVNGEAHVTAEGAMAGPRSTLAVSVLVGGLFLSTVVALGLLAVLLGLLVR
jgi:hypothetical protein